MENNVKSDKKYPDRKRLYNLDLNRWYTYKNKNEKSSLNISFGESSSIIWINERTINEVNKDVRTMIMVDNSMLYNIIYLFKTEMSEIKESKDKIKVDIVTYDKATKNKTLKISLIFGKDDEGFYLGVIIPHKNSIKFPLIPSDKFTELRVYKMSEQVMKNKINEGFTNLWLDTVLDTIKDGLKGKLFQDQMEVTVEKNKSEEIDKIDDFETFEEPKSNAVSNDIDDFDTKQEVKEEPIKDNDNDDIKTFMDEVSSMDSSDDSDTSDALDEFINDDL